MILLNETGKYSKSRHWTWKHALAGGCGSDAEAMGLSSKPSQKKKQKKPKTCILYPGACTGQIGQVLVTLALDSEPHKKKKSDESPCKLPYLR